MHDPNSLMGVSFRYARWLRETEQWEAMELFTFVIHPAIGRLAGMGKTRIADLTPAIVDRTLAVAAQDRIDRVLALGSWSDFLDFLDVEGVPHNPNLLDREASLLTAIGQFLLLCPVPTPSLYGTNTPFRPALVPIVQRGQGGKGSLSQYMRLVNGTGVLGFRANVIPRHEGYWWGASSCCNVSTVTLDDCGVCSC